LQLLKYQGGDEIKDWLQRKTNKYTSHEIQNSFLNMMALDALKVVTEKLQKSPYLTVTIDEATDVTNQEQVTMYSLAKKTILKHLKNLLTFTWFLSSKLRSLPRSLKNIDTMIRLNLSMQKLRGQCYDGCSTTSGTRTGVNKKISDEEPCALFTHCYDHSLNLLVNDTVKKSKLLKQA